MRNSFLALLTLVFGFVLLKLFNCYNFCQSKELQPVHTKLQFFAIFVRLDNKYVQQITEEHSQDLSGPGYTTLFTVSHLSPCEEKKKKSIKNLQLAITVTFNRQTTCMKQKLLLYNTNKLANILTFKLV